MLSNIHVSLWREVQRTETAQLLQTKRTCENWVVPNDRIRICFCPTGLWNKTVWPLILWVHLNVYIVKLNNLLLQGGMKAVIWTDTIQLCVMTCGIIAIVIQGSLQVGGLGEVMRIAHEGGRINFKEWVMMTTFPRVPRVSFTNVTLLFTYRWGFSCDDKDKLNRHSV